MLCKKYVMSFWKVHDSDWESFLIRASIKYGCLVVSVVYWLSLNCICFVVFSSGKWTTSLLYPRVEENVTSTTCGHSVPRAIARLLHSRHGHGHRTKSNKNVSAVLPTHWISPPSFNPSDLLYLRL